MQIKKALTFRASSIGDSLMAKYFLDNIHAQFPEAKLGIVIASRGNMIRDLFAGSPYIEVIETNRRDVRGLWNLWKRFHGSEVVTTQYAGKHGGQFGLASKIAARLLAKRGGLIGFTDVSRWNKFLYNRLLPVRPDFPVVEHEREALRVAGLAVALPYPRLHIEEKPDIIEKYKLVPGQYIIAHFFAGNAGRSISPTHAHKLLVELGLQFPDVCIVLSGGKADRRVADEIAEGLPRMVVVAGNASLQEMMQLIQSSMGSVSVDTGIAHITAQLEKPLVVMRTCLGPNWWFPEQYGPQAPVRQFSRENLCTPHVNKHYPDCINMIDISQVARASKELFH